MEPHGARCRGCRGVSTQGHLQLVLDHEGDGQGVRVYADDVNIAPLTQQPQALQHQQYGLACKENAVTELLVPLLWFHCISMHCTKRPVMVRSICLIKHTVLRL